MVGPVVWFLFALITILVLAVLILLIALKRNLAQTLAERSDRASQLEAQLSTLQVEARDGRVENERRLSDGFAAARKEDGESATRLRDELSKRQGEMQDSITRILKALGTGLQEKLESTQGEIRSMSRGNEKRLNTLRETLDVKIVDLQTSNEKKLEEMRVTVNEKLQSTLEKRLGESFSQVREQLEAVQTGVGEMRGLAGDVGDLKRVMSNVKARGVFGEAQLGRLLEQILTSEQYGVNVNVTGKGREQVEFAVKLPGQDADGTVWLPIDSKFPVSDFERLETAREKADLPAMEAARKALIQRVKQQAKEIQTKYISVPETTDFAILFLPTEGLFAEVLREPGLVDGLLREFHIILTGPTTLAAILSSLQMGFRTLAIEKRSSDVWKILGATKTEFAKYSDLMKKLSKKLGEAQRTIDEDIGRRTRVIEGKLKQVETMDLGQTATLLGLESLDTDQDA
jgi:DNA recombination protein RmuC